MGTSSEGTKIIPDLTFDGTAKHWPVFKQRLLKYADSQGFAYMLETGQSICTIFQAASASAAKSKTTKGSAVVAGSGTISLTEVGVPVERNLTAGTADARFGVRGRDRLL